MSRHKSGQNPLKEDRSKFWFYCQQAEHGAIDRARVKGVPCTIDAYFIDTLFVDQEWRCAISGITFKAPKGGNGLRTDPFGPSLDRVDPELGYVPGNVRLVSNIVNMAMSEWGLESLITLVDAMGAKIINEGRRRRIKTEKPKSGSLECDQNFPTSSKTRG